LVSAKPLDPAENLGKLAPLPSLFHYKRLPVFQPPVALNGVKLWGE
jgi:hypothetical protein